MYFLNKKNFESKIALVSFIIFFFIGLNITKDYGVSSDEYNSRIKGFVTLNYIGNLFAPELNKKIKGDKNIPNFDEFDQSALYGPVFDTTASFLEIIFNLKDKKNQFLLRHYLNFLVFFVATIYFYRILKLRLANKYTALLGSIILILSPRIFANSFYNNKDLVFLSFYIISSYYSLKLIENQNFKNMLKFSFFSALAIDIRILGILLVALNIFLCLIKNIYQNVLIKNLIITISTLLLSSIFTILFWPYLWEAPLDNFFNVFIGMANFDINTYNLFFGQFINGKETPWYFIPIWIIITTPFLYIFLFFVGFIHCFVNFIKNINFLNQKTILFDLFFGATIVIPIITIIFLGSTIYNGWRQVYFIYSGIIYFSVIGFVLIKNSFERKYINLISIVLILNLFLVFKWMIINHPHQYVFFNNLLPKKNLEKKFDLDYWGLSYKENFEYILNNDKKEKIKIFNLSHNKLFYPLLSIEDQKRKRFKVVNNLEQADYLFNNFYLPKKLNKIDQNEIKIFNQIVVDGISINTVYKKKN